jgi:predicted O-methyltransferase YrrM
MATAATSWFRPSYVRSLARETDKWGWERRRRPMKTVTLEALEADSNEPFELRLFRGPFAYGDTLLVDTAAVATLVHLRKPKTVFEFGTFRGLMTVNLAINAHGDARVYTLDIPPEQRHTLPTRGWDRTIDDRVIGELYRRSAHAGRITQVLCDSRALDTAPYAGRMDFVFIDASHDYESVVNDTNKALEMVSEEGVVAWHDYASDYPGVHRHLHELGRQREVVWIVGTRVAFMRGRGYRQ